MSAEAELRERTDVAERAREIDLRIALGASDAGDCKLDHAPTTRWLAVGLALGTALAVGIGLLTRATLHDAGPLDAGCLGLSLAIVVVTAIAATSLPVRWALRVSPLEALRAK